MIWIKNIRILKPDTTTVSNRTHITLFILKIILSLILFLNPPRIKKRVATAIIPNMRSALWRTVAYFRKYMQGSINTVSHTPLTYLTLKLAPQWSKKMDKNNQIFFRSRLIIFRIPRYHQLGNMSRIIIFAMKNP